MGDTGGSFRGACEWCGRAGHVQDTDCPDYPRFSFAEGTVSVRYDRRTHNAHTFEEAWAWVVEQAAAARRAETVSAVAQLRRMVRLEEFADQMTPRLQRVIADCECGQKGCHQCQEARAMLAILRDD